jgi:hypothetical protein
MLQNADIAITHISQITNTWLATVLEKPVTRFEAMGEQSAWSQQVPLRVYFSDDTEQFLRLKICLGATFGRSEVDYYCTDYAGLTDAPLVRCYDAQYEAGVGYHVLLDDLSATHHNRFDVTPTLEYGLTVARALGRLHQHYWESQPVPDDATWERYFAHISPGVGPMEQATRQAFTEHFIVHQKTLLARYRDKRGMSLLHGDLNPGNILTPKTADSPVYFLDRQPFDWSLTYGLALYDLAYCFALWWPTDIYKTHIMAILRCWHTTLQQPDYTWEMVQTDWRLCVEQCLHVPIEWCADTETITKMRWVWEPQLARIQSALA